MSKKKNTLKDLDEFLKQQAATLVTPARLSKSLDAGQTTETTSSVETVGRATPKTGSTSADKGDLFQMIQELADLEPANFNRVLYDLIIRSLEYKGEYTPEDKMLINTALYLKHPEDWKETIRRYWKKKADL